METRILQTGTLQLTVNKGESVIIPDEVEGNMCFTFRFIGDNGHNNSYTQYNVIDKFNAEIVISSPNEKAIHPQSKFEVGTYQNTYKLFVDYLLEGKVDGRQDRTLKYVFIINK